MANESQLSQFVLYHGVNEPPPELIELKAGPVRVSFDPKQAFLRYIRIGDDEILRGVYSAVRDQNWGTVTPRVSDLKIEQSPGAFAISFQVDCTDDPIDFRWSGKITGSADGTVRYSMDGAARSTFLRNRLGFCVLHPLTCSGRDCTIEKVDGSTERGVFPDLISPHQPFFDVRAITHEVSSGVNAEVRMEGDTFESEDQRNWTDASYKTYGTRLAEPFPVEVEKGTRIQQSVTLSLKGVAKPVSVNARRPEVLLEISGKGTPLPRIGFGLSANAPLPNETERDRLRALHPAHLRVDLRLGGSDWKDHLQRAVTEESLSLKAPLEIAAFVTDAAGAQLDALAAEAKRMKARVVRWLIFHEDEPSTADRWLALAQQRLDGEVGAGTDANFTELNRGRPSQPGDVVCYSMNPQVHAFDNRTLVEAFEGQRHTVRTARSFCGDARVAVTPVTLKARFNAVATAAETAVDPGVLPKTVDPRQMSLLGAGWTLGSIQALAESGADSATYYETIGWSGLMETKTGSRLPDKFGSIPGSVFPLYHVFADLAECAGCEVLPVRIADPLKIAALALWQKKGGARLLLANLTSEPRYLRIEHQVMSPRLGIWTIDEHSALRAMTAPEEFRREAGRKIFESSPVKIALLPYAYMKVDPV